MLNFVLHCVELWNNLMIWTTTLMKMEVNTQVPYSVCVCMWSRV